jgi:hypothetical protein
MYLSEIEFVIGKAGRIRVGFHHPPDYAVVGVVIEDLGYLAFDIDGAFGNHGSGVEFAVERIEE